MTENPQEMTDQTEATEAPDLPTGTPDTGDTAEAADRVDSETVDTDPVDNDPALVKARREAANYRTKLRAAETKATALRDQLVTLTLGEGNVTLTALQAAGVNLDDLIGDDGTLDTDRVREAADTAREALGIPAGRFNGTADQGAANRTATPTGPTWGALLK